MDLRASVSDIDLLPNECAPLCTTYVELWCMRLCILCILWTVDPSNARIIYYVGGNRYACLSSHCTATYFLKAARKTRFLCSGCAAQKVMDVGTVKHLLQLRAAEISGNAPKIPNAVAEDCTDFLQIFLEEAIRRAAKQARRDADSTVSSTHLEKVLPQLLLDF